MALIPTTTGPQQDHLKLLSDFFGGADGETSPLDVLKNLSDNGGGGADIRAGIDARRQQEGELNDRLAADPRNLRLQMLSKQMGIEDAANPDSDLNVQASQLADTQAKQAASRSLLPDVRAAKAQSMADAGTQAQDVARGTATGTAQGQFSPEAQAVADAASKRKINEVVAPKVAMLNGEGGSSDVIDQLARHPEITPPSDMKDAVAVRSAQLGTMRAKLSNQQQQMAEGSQQILDALPEAIGLAKDLKDKGLFQPVIGSLRQMLAEHGMGSLAMLDDSTSNSIGKFNALMGTIKAAYARALAGARGAGNSGMATRFDKLAPTQGDFPTFLGSLQGMGDELQRSAALLNPGAVNTADPYSDPNYQPK